MTLTERIYHASGAAKIFWSVGAALIAAGIAWGINHQRINEIERRNSAQDKKIEQLRDDVNQNIVTTAVFNERLRSIEGTLERIIEESERQTEILKRIHKDGQN